MLRNLWSLYIPDRNHLALYLHAFGKTISGSIIATFTGAWLYSLGLPLYHILLFYAVNFGVMGLCSPLGLVFVLKHGVFKTQLASNIFMLAGCFAIALVERNILFIIPGVLLQSLSSGLINPVYDVMQAIYVNDKIRGRSYALTLAITSISSMLGLWIGGVTLTLFSFWGVACFCAIALLVGTLPLLLLEERVRHSDIVRLDEAYREPFTPAMRRYFPAFFGEQFSIIGRAVLVPLFLFILAGNFKTMAGVMILSIAAEAIAMLCFGHWMDRAKTHRPLFSATASNASAFLFYAFFAKSPLSLIFAETWRRLTTNFFTTAFRGHMHHYAKNTKPRLILFGMVWQMMLCASELVTLLVFALAAWVYGVDALPWLLVLCAIGIFLSPYAARRFKTRESESDA